MGMVVEVERSEELEWLGMMKKKWLNLLNHVR